MSEEYNGEFSHVAGVKYPTGRRSKTSIFKGLVVDLGTRAKPIARGIGRASYRAGRSASIRGVYGISPAEYQVLQVLREQFDTTGLTRGEYATMMRIEAKISRYRHKYSTAARKTGKYAFSGAKSFDKFMMEGKRRKVERM